MDQTRLVVQGYRQEKEPQEKQSTLLLRMFRLHIHQIDVFNASCYADIAGYVYMWVPLMRRRWSRGGATNYRSRCVDFYRLRGDETYIKFIKSLSFRVV